MTLTLHIKRNAAQCLKCDDVIESKHVHQFVRCSCGEIFVDGGKEYLRRGANSFDNLIDLSEYYTEEDWKEVEAYRLTFDYKEAKRKYQEEVYKAVMRAKEFYESERTD